MSKDLFTRKRINISDLSFNTGQVPGLPKNPRFIRDQKFEAMCQSIREDPEYLEVREVLIYDYQGVNVVIAGEMRTRGAKHEGHKEVPCKVFPESTPIEKIRAYAIKDNAHYGEWDQDSLANDWEAGELKEWGVDSPWAEQLEGESEYDKSKFNESADSYANNTIRQIVLYFDVETHAKVLSQMDNIAKKYEIEEDNSAVVLKLIEFYETKKD